MAISTPELAKRARVRIIFSLPLVFQEAITLRRMYPKIIIAMV
jgi:hypothetical protein